MSYTVRKQSPCKRCETPTMRRERNTRDPLCFECAMKKMDENWRSLAAHSGEGYDRWLDGYVRFINRQGRGRVVPYNLQ